MPKYSKASLAELDTCDVGLQRIAYEAIKYVDIRIVKGHRGQAEQHAAFLAGTSQLDWPHGNHNALPSRAFDFSPWPEDWSDKTTALARFTFAAGVLWTVSRQLSVPIRFGWDWNQNLDPRDERFLDWGHVELHSPPG